MLPMVAVAAIGAIHLSASATYVIDSRTEEALPGASIIDRRGNMAGVVNPRGQIPWLPLSAYPLSVRCLGYVEASVNSPDVDTVALETDIYNLPELTVDAKKHQVLHLIGYMREYSTASTYNDTVTMFREKTIDFMIPTLREKKYQGWSYPRILASRSFYRFTDSNGRDSVSDYFRQNFSWSDMVGLLPPTRIPEEVADPTQNASYTEYGRYSPIYTWRRLGDNILLDNDPLAGEEDESMLPELYRIFSSHIDFTGFKVKYLYSDVDADIVLPDHISRITFTIESQGRGKDLRYIFPTDGPVYMNTYAELFITDREYMSVSDARKWEKHPLLGDEIGIVPPDDISDLPVAVSDLVKRVGEIDSDALRLKEERDSKIGIRRDVEYGRKKRKLLRKVKGILTGIS